MRLQHNISPPAPGRGGGSRKRKGAPDDEGGNVNMEGAAGEPALNPSLRPSQAVLIDQDDDFLRSLPSHMIAEAGV